MDANQLTMSVRYVILDKSGGCTGSYEREVVFENQFCVLHS